MTIGSPARSTIVTETLYPKLRHRAIAALAMVCASASVIFFCKTMPCAPTGDDKTAATVKPARPLAIDNMRQAPCYFVDRAANIPPPAASCIRDNAPFTCSSTRGRAGYAMSVLLLQQGQ